MTFCHLAVKLLSSIRQVDKKMSTIFTIVVALILCCAIAPSLLSFLAGGIATMAGWVVGLFIGLSGVFLRGFWVLLKKTPSMISQYKTNKAIRQAQRTRF